MLKAIKLSFNFMTLSEKFKWSILVGLRSTLALLDLAGVLAIGYLVTSSVSFLSEGSDPGREFEFGGITLPSVTIQTLPFVASAILAMFLVKAVLSISLTRRAAFFVAKVEARAVKVISEIRFSGNLITARKYSREEMMHAVGGGAGSAFNILLNSFNSFLTETVLFLVVAVGFFFIDPVVTVAAIFYFGLIAFVIQYFIGSLMGRAEEEKYTSSLRSATAVSDLLSVFRELVVMGRRDKYIDEIFKARSSVAKTTAITFYLSGMPRYIIEAALLVGVALFVLSQAVSGDIASTAGKVGIFLAGGFRLTAALLPLQSSLLVLKSAIPAAKLAHDILESAHETVKATDHPDVGNPEQTEDQLPIGVVFENVTFYYPDSKTPTLVDLNFTIEPGSQTALMGPSGAGKSTIADLLCFLLSPTSGRVFRISNSLEKEWESVGRVSYVPQKPGMVSGTILENVALGVDPQSVNRLDVIAALEEAHLGTLISELPKGIDTPLGKLKDSLSGGQMQRLGLARAIYFKPSLLVMDEATSALDAESESEIQKTLEELRGKVTVVVIAHRLNTIQHADKVILVEDGKVLDSGKFKELIARNPSVERGVELMRIDESDTP